MKKRLVTLILFMVVIFSAYAGEYEPKVAFSKVTRQDVITPENENYKLSQLENLLIGFEDGENIIGTWTVEMQAGSAGAVPTGWTLHESDLYFYVTQEITFVSDGTYTTTDYNLYEPAYAGADSGKWHVAGNQFIVMSDADSVNGKRSYRSAINKVNNYRWSTTVSKTQTGLYFSKPEAPPRVPVNLSLEHPEGNLQIGLTWEYSSTNDGFSISKRIDTINEETGYWIPGVWQTNVAETDSETKQALIDVGNPGKYLFRVQAFKINGSNKVHSPMGGGNTRSIIIK
ncbi:hypothetical protein KAR91_55880 [Candidatus Pacearchaeota archaeon]|nr:hypothetical protein [Candidatus Pacearchaeota archaeon]